MVQRLLTRYSQASPAPERAPRAKNGQAAVGHIFEGQCWAVCFEPRASLGIPPEHSPTLGRSVGLISASTKTRTKSWLLLDACTTPSRVNAPRIVCVLTSLESCFKPRLRGRRNAGLRRNSRPQLQPLLQRLRLACKAPPAGPSRRKHHCAALGTAHKSRQSRLRKRRAAKDDGLARQFRTASTHRRGCHR